MDAIEKLPLPSNKTTKDRTVDKQIVPGISYAQSPTGLDLVQEFTNFVEPFNGQSFDVHTNFSVDLINQLNTILRKVNSSNSLFLNLGENVNPDSANSFLKLLKDYNSNTEFVKKKYAVLNSVVANIKQIISTPSNQLIANEPVDVDEWQKAAKLGLDKREEVTGEKPQLLSSLDGMSMMQQQKDASVGKDDVGIAANGLKVYFALTSYYNDHYKKDLPIQENDYKLFNKQFVMNGKPYNISTLADVKIRKHQIANLEKFISKGEQKLDVFKSQAAIAMSGFTSLATDNAKELAMAKLNASVQLASMHLYMLSIGISMNDIALFMNSKTAIDISKKLESNLFSKSKDDTNFVNMVIDGIKNIADPDELSTFSKIYNGAQEFKMLSGFLRVNQKTSANTDELNKFLNNLETTMYARENILFGKSLFDLRNFAKLGVKNLSAEDNAVIDKIAANNITIKNRNVIINTLIAAKELGISGGLFDFRKYLTNEVDESGNNIPLTKYQKITKDYYNLIKDTVNIYDVIDSVPHFKAMIGGVKISHNMLLMLSKKYNFAFNKLRDIVREKTDSLQSENKSIKNQLGNTALPTKIGDKELRNAFLCFDKFLVGKWLQTKDTTISSPSNISFDVAELMKLANVKTIDLYDADSKTSTSSSVTVELDENNELVGENLIVTLDTDHGIANFKKVMESLVLPILNSPAYSSELVDSLTLKSLKTQYGIPMTAIVSTFSMGQLNNPVNIDKFQKLITDFNDLDLKVTKLTNTFNKEMN